MNSVDEVLPDINFPTFPISVTNPDITFSLEDRCVIIRWKGKKEYASIPLDVWEDLTRYVIDVEEARQKYKALQEVYGKETKLPD